MQPDQIQPSPKTGASAPGISSTVKPIVTGFFDAATFTISYIVQDPGSQSCAIIDSVLDFDQASGRTRTESADRLISHVQEQDLRVDWILETHVHADHLSAAPYLQQHLGGKIAIGHNITTVQNTFGKVFNEGTEFQRDGSQFDQLLSDGDTVAIGHMVATAWETPGHTPACMSYVIGDACFVGDTLFMPDGGTARCDFPGGDARTLYRSVKRILALPPETRLFMCHDYAPGGREYAWETTVAAQRAGNIHVHDGIDEPAFVALRTERDATLAMPRLILPSLQINMRAGQKPPPEDNGVSYLKLPLDLV